MSTFCTYLKENQKLCQRESVDGYFCCPKHQRRNDRLIEKATVVKRAPSQVHQEQEVLSLKQMILHGYRNGLSDLDNEVDVEDLVKYPSVKLVKQKKISAPIVQKFPDLEFEAKDTKEVHKLRLNTIGLRSICDDKPEFIWERFQNKFGYDFPTSHKVRDKFIESMKELGAVTPDHETSFYCRQCDKKELVFGKKRCETHPDSVWFLNDTCVVKWGSWDVLVNCFRFSGLKKSDSALIVFGRPIPGMGLEKRMIAEWVIRSRPSLA